MRPAAGGGGPRQVRIPRPHKALFPCGITKGELAAYYERVGATMLTHIRDRPLILERYPDGISGERVIQQRPGKHFPAWVPRTRVPMRGGGTVEHVIARDVATLVYLAGQACITPHCWLSRCDRPEQPDRLIIDLDPPGDEPGEARRAALLLGEVLAELRLKPWPMSTGSRGFHLVCPLRRQATFEQVRALARGVAALAVGRAPELLTTEQRKDRRGGRILIDVMRNAYAHAAVAPYAVRARPHAPVATPLRWEELCDRATRPDRFTLRTLPERLARDGDPWRELQRHSQSLARARRALDEALAELGAVRGTT
jgi:bifunctional non-homologous end joining protein LigD